MKGILVKTLLRCSALFLVVFALARPAAAATTRVEVQALWVSGNHTEIGGAAQALFLPAPLLRITTSEKRWAIFVEGATTFGRGLVAQNVGFNTGASSAAISYLNGVVRYHINALTTLGIGETIYNQKSLYDAIGFFGEPYAQASRVVGARFELRSEIYSTVHSRWHADLALNPRLTTDLVQYEPTNDADGDEGILRSTPESGSLVDASISNRVENRRYALTYGIRYVNEAMFYPYDQLAHRESLVVPFVGIARTFGH